MKITEATERDLRVIALEIKKKLKEWFTDSQIAKLYGNEEKHEVIGMLNFVGLLESANVDGGWKHRIIDSAQKRVDILKANIAAIDAKIKEDVDNKAYFEAMIKQIEEEI